jgi:hypothetical protein
MSSRKRKSYDTITTQTNKRIKIDYDAIIADIVSCKTTEDVLGKASHYASILYDTFTN